MYLCVREAGVIVTCVTCESCAHAACKVHTPVWSMCRRGAVRLGMSKVTQVDFVPKELVSYSKETQTPTEAVAHTDQKAGDSR